MFYNPYANLAWFISLFLVGFIIGYFIIGPALTGDLF